jgi:hypothetical protein
MTAAQRVMAALVVAVMAVFIKLQVGVALLLVELLIPEVVVVAVEFLVVLHSLAAEGQV